MKINKLYLLSIISFILFANSVRSQVQIIPKIGITYAGIKRPDHGLEKYPYADPVLSLGKRKISFGLTGRKKIFKKTFLQLGFNYLQLGSSNFYILDPGNPEGHVVHDVDLTYANTQLFISCKLIQNFNFNLGFYGSYLSSSKYEYFDPRFGFLGHITIDGRKLYDSKDYGFCFGIDYRLYNFLIGCEYFHGLNEIDVEKFNRALMFSLGYIFEF